MGTKVRIQIASDIARILGTQRDVQAIEHDRAEQALTIARDIAPVDTGDYVESLDVDGNELFTDDPMGHLVEWGSVNNRAYAVLRQASSQVATRLVENPK